jgi:hypothetical protein
LTHLSNSLALHYTLTVMIHDASCYV